MRALVFLAVGLLLSACAEQAPVRTAALPAAPAPKPAPATAAPPKPAAVTVTPVRPRTVLHLDITPADAGLDKVMRAALKVKAGQLELDRGGKAVPAGAVRLTVRHFRWNEGEQPQATRTVSYRPDQVTAGPMPAGSLYQVDHVTGKAVVGFSFRLTLERDGIKLGESEITDRVEAPWSTCRLARIVTPTGTARAAHFVANAEMEALCAGQAAPVVGEAAAVRLADAVLALARAAK